MRRSTFLCTTAGPGIAMLKLLLVSGLLSALGCSGPIFEGGDPAPSRIKIFGTVSSTDVIEKTGLASSAEAAPAPVTKAKVIVFNTHGQRVTSTVTNKAGRYTADVTQVADYSILAEKIDSRSGQKLLGLVGLPNNRITGETVEAPPVLLQASGSIVGDVTYADANDDTQIRALAQVCGTDLFAATATSGAYTLLGIPAGTHNICIGSAIGYGNATVSDITVDPGKTTDAGTVTLEPVSLDDMGIVSGTILDVDTNTPVEGVYVSVDGLGGTSQDVSRQDGSFELALQAGTWTLAAISPYYTQFNRPDVEVVVGESVTTEILMLAVDTPGGTITGRLVVKGSNVAIVSAAVEVQPTIPGNGVGSDANGRWSRNVPADYCGTLTFTHTDFKPASRYACAPENGTIDLGDIELTSKGSNGTATCVQPPSGIVHWWTGDTDASDLIGDAHGTFMSGAGITSNGYVDGGFVLDGIDDYINIGNAEGLDFLPSSEHTVEAWIYVQGDTGTEQKILTTNYLCPGPAQTLSVLPDADDSFRYGLNNGDVGSSAISAVANPFENFYHLAGSRVFSDGAYHMQLYINGNLVATQEDVTAGPVSQAVDDFIGARDSCATGALRFFWGTIDELSVYSRALSNQEIESIYNAGSLGKCKQ